MADAGNVAWDMDRFRFLDAQDSYDSIHPSLQRMGRLNNNYGLYEVIPGIYQVRGFDLAQITFIRGRTGWIVFDVLVSAETARAAWTLFQQHRGEGLPITAIVSFIALAAAFVHGFDAVILSNERSANQGNLMRGGREINHQFSKTASMERALSDYVARYIDTGLAYFSLLRPLSEAHIAQLMARTSLYDGAFTSCNRAFQLRPKEEPKRWCRDCPKCRFTFLMLATAMERPRLEAIFGGNMLEDDTQLTGFEELMGLSGHKPWECVGELAESGAALLMLARHPDWRDTTIVRALAPRVAALMGDPAPVWRALMTPSPEHAVPPRFEEMLNGFL
jgi:hypothetical protein